MACVTILTVLMGCAKEHPTIDGFWKEKSSNIIGQDIYVDYIEIDGMIMRRARHDLNTFYSSRPCFNIDTYTLTNIENDIFHIESESESTENESIKISNVAEDDGRIQIEWFEGFHPTIYRRISKDEINIEPECVAKNLPAGSGRIETSFLLSQVPEKIIYRESDFQTLGVSYTVEFDVNNDEKMGEGDIVIELKSYISSGKNATYTFSDMKPKLYYFINESRRELIFFLDKPAMKIRDNKIVFSLPRYGGTILPTISKKTGMRFIANYYERLIGENVVDCYPGCNSFAILNEEEVGYLPRDDVSSRHSDIIEVGFVITDI